MGAKRFGCDGSPYKFVRNWYYYLENYEVRISEEL